MLDLFERVGEVTALTSVFVALAYLLLRHRLVLFGRRMNGNRYIFVIQNVEEVPLRAALQIKLTVKSGDGKIEEANLMCGRAQIREEQDAEGRSRTFWARNLAGLTSWVVDCTTDGQDGGVELSIHGWDEDAKRTTGYFPLIDNKSYFAQSTNGADDIEIKPQPSRFTAFFGCAMSLLTFVLVADLASRGFNRGDAVYALALVLLSLLGFGFCRREPSPVIQGYLGWD